MSDTCSYCLNECQTRELYNCPLCGNCCCKQQCIAQCNICKIYVCTYCMDECPQCNKGVCEKCGIRGEGECESSSECSGHSETKSCIECEKNN
jgi:hypothetical protein